MFRHLLVLLALSALPVSPAAADADASRWHAEAARVTISRDDWGIAHVHGRSDADAVFGMIYAQAEDDFNRIETNYLTALGRTAEAEGEGAIWGDLRARLYMDPAELRARYAASPAWLKRLMTAWADGLNFYLARHPQVTPRVIRRFEPWMALSFTEGSIGGDIETIDLADLAKFYGANRHPELVSRSSGSSAPRFPDWMLKQVQHDGEVQADVVPASVQADAARQVEPTGSNGFAIAPSHTAAGHACC